MAAAGKQQAQAPFQADFVRLGRSTWLTLESSIRSEEHRAVDLEKRLVAIGNQVQQVNKMGVPWMKLGQWNQRRSKWTSDEWLAFLKMWGNYGSFAFGNEVTTEEEQKLVDAFVDYYNFYASVPERPTNAPSNVTMEEAGQQVDAQLKVFHKRLGDPMDSDSSSSLWIVLSLLIVILAIYYWRTK